MPAAPDPPARGAPVVASRAVAPPGVGSRAVAPPGAAPVAAGPPPAGSPLGSLSPATTATSGKTVRAGGAARRRRAWHRPVLAAAAVATVVVGALQAPAAVADFTRAFTHLRPARLPWLAAAVAAEVASFAFYAALQQVLLGAGGHRVRNRVLLRLAVASSGLRALLPIGVVPSSGWLLGEYRRMGVSGPASLYAVLASGYASTVVLLGLLLLGSAIAGLGAVAVLLPSAVLLLAGSAGFVALVHRLGALRQLERACRGRLAGAARAVVQVAEGIGQLRVGTRGGAAAFGAATGNWLADIVCLITAFALLGVTVPWRGLLFAYALAQVAGSLVPLPGGLGAVEGGLVGALDLAGINAGVALAVAIVYRIVTYWGVALLGGIELAVVSRHPPGPGDLRPVARAPSVRRVDDRASAS